MLRIFRNKPTVHHGGTSISCRPGTVRVSSPTAFSASGGRWFEFLSRIMSLPAVESVEIDRLRGAAAVTYNPKEIAVERLLEQMSAALLSEGGDLSDSPISEWQHWLSGRLRLRLFRRGTSLSIWEIVHELAGRLRVRDVDLHRCPQVAQRIRSELALQRGVQDVTISPLTGSVVIRFDTAVTDRNQVLAQLDELTRDGDLAACPEIPSRSKWLYASATLALAVAGTTLYPPLLPASAALLVASSISTFKNAWRQLLRRETGLPVLHTAIVAATLASGGFLASSLMNWLLLHWQDRRARLTAAGQQLLNRSIRMPKTKVWIVRDGVELEASVASLQIGTVIAVREGEWMPVDGRIVSGRAILEERSISGRNALVCRSTGDSVFEGAFVVEGELNVEVLRTGEKTIATTIGEALTGAAAHRPAAVPEVAQRAVPPSLMTAGIGLLVGDATLAAAVLRPDYATGPGIGDSLTLIDRLSACLDEGIVVRNPAVFEEMADADLVLFDHDRQLAVRVTQVEEIHVEGPLAPFDILDYAECAVRQFHDPRARAVVATHRAQGRVPLEIGVGYRSGTVELGDRGRTIRVEGLAAAGTPVESPLRIFCNGELAGSVTFCEGEAALAAEAVLELRARCGMQVELVSSASAPEANRLADALGVDGLYLSPSDESRADLIRECRANGRRVVYVGDCQKYPQAAAAANVAVNPCPDPASDIDVSGVWLLTPQYEKIAQLRSVAEAMRRQAQVDFNLILIPNVVCIAGAFLFGFTSLVVVVLSNLGTYSVYSRSRAALRRTERRLLERRRRFDDASLRQVVRMQKRLTVEGTE